MDAIEEKLGKLWIEVAAEFGFEYEEVEKNVYKLKNHEEGLIKHFGSASQNKPATFWWTKAQIEFRRRLNDL